MKPASILRSALSHSPATSKALTAFEISTSVRLILASGAFDQAYYETLARRRFRNTAEAVYHYVRIGRSRGLSGSLLVEPEWYSPEYWKTYRADPLARYLAREVNTGRPAHPLFSPDAWKEQHPEARKFPGGVLAHFLSTAPDDAVMPVVPEAAGLARAGELTWGETRHRLTARSDEWLVQEARRRAERVTFSYDHDADAAYVARWSSSPLPVTDGPLVSIVMPVYNRAATVLTAIASVRAQTLTDWELVVVDDGSTDATAEVVGLVAAEDPRVKLVRGDHGGVSRARNLAAEHARGRYVAWLDSDNAWHPYYLRTAVAALHGSGQRAGFASLEMISKGKRSYRALEGTIDLLDVGNHVDLNVLVVERSLLDEVGGFDETLRRTVDYDLTWRLWRQAPLTHLPFVGVTYTDDREDPDRISNRELKSWTEAVKNKHLIDWAAQERDLPQRVAGRVSLLVPTWRDWELTWKMATTVLAAADALPAGSPGSDIEIVVLDNGSQRAVGQILESLSLLDPRVRVVRQPVNTNFGLGSNLAFAASTGATVVFLNNDTEVWPGWLPPLLAALDDPDVLGAQPLLTYPDGTIQCAGLVFPDRGTFPYHFLQHHPAQDATRMGTITANAVTGAAFAVRAADVVALQGFECLYVNGWEDVDFCLRLSGLRPNDRGAGHFAVVSASQVTHHESKTPGRGNNNEPNRALFHSRWFGRTPTGDAAMWKAAGFDVAFFKLWEDKHIPGILRIPQPTVVHPGATVKEGPGAGLPSLRWAIKIAAPSGPVAEAWGDLHFARALAAALERLGQQAAIDFREAVERSTIGLDDVVVSLRGLDEIRMQPGRINLLWVISHPELVHVAEMRQFDAVFAASIPWAEKASTLLGSPVVPLLQATDATRFRPDVAEPDTGERVLFLGNSRNIYRPVVRHLVEAGVDVGVHGSRWAQFLPAAQIRSELVPNSEVPALYRAAGVVLNDHWDDMRAEGFMSNRLFDASAVGARIVSDAVAGTELFGGLVQTYDTAEELLDLVTHPANSFPDDAARVKLADQVRAEHSFDARARTLLDTALRLRG